MQIADRTTASSSHMSSSPFAVDLSQFMQTQEGDDDKNQSRIIKWAKDNEKEPDLKTIEVGVKESKAKNSPLKNKAYNHQKDPIVISMKKWYQIRGWSLLYPLLVSMYLVVSELDFNIRTMGYTFMALTCVWCFCNLKNFESQKNLKCILLAILCMLIVLADFLFEFSLIGNKGWAATGGYQNCFNFTGEMHHKEVHDRICSIFKAVYYLNSLTYLGTMISFSVYLLATSKLVKLVSGSGNNQRMRFEDEVEVDIEN